MLKDNPIIKCLREKCPVNFHSRVGKKGEQQKLYCSDECRKLAYQKRKILIITCPHCGKTSEHSQATVLADNNKPRTKKKKG